MKHKGKKGISILLVFLLTVQLFAVDGLAEETDTYSGNVSDTGAESTETVNFGEMAEPDSAEADPVIIGEVEDLREESVKHFRTEDGSFLAVDYGMPVHYQDAAGIWQDIDNSLQKEEDRYRVSDVSIDRVFAGSLSKGDLYSVKQGEYGVSMSLVAEESVYDRVAAGSLKKAEGGINPEEGLAETDAVSSDGMEASPEAVAPIGDIPAGRLLHVSGRIRG